MKNKTIYARKPWLMCYPEGVLAEVDLPNKSLAQAFDEAVEKWKDKTALIFYGKKMSYRELGDQVNRFATALSDLGVKKGHKVALLLVSSPQFIIAFYGALKAGATVTPISPMYVSVEIKHQLEDSESQHIVCQDVLYDRVEKAGTRLDNVILTNIGEYLPGLKRFFGKSVLRAVYQRMSAPSPEVFQREGFHQFQDLIKRYSPNPPTIGIDPKEDLALLPYTGGTTGLPKGVMLTHYNLLADEAQWYSFWSSVLEEGKEMYIAIMPFYHIGGLEISVVGGIIRGYTIVILTTPDLDDVLDAIQTYEGTIFGSVPSFFEVLREYEKVDRVDWKSLKVVFTGADTLLESTAVAWKKRTGTELYEIYGLTETSLATHCSPKDKVKIGSFGVPIPGTMAAVLHPEKDESLPVGEIGEIAVKGSQVFKGYWKNPEETEGRFAEVDGEMWFRTGDLGSMDEEGYFYFYDRKRDLMKYKGYAVFAREVEEVLSSHPQIKEVGVVGVPDPKVGENIKAVVVLEHEARGKLSEQEIIKWCEANLAHYKIPKIVKFRGEIPKTDVGKVSRRELREGY